MQMQKRPLTPEDILSFTCVGDPQLSPDGTKLAYVRQYFDKDTHKAHTDIFLIDTLYGTTIQLTNSGKDSSPRWSPSGNRIAFKSSRSGKSQIWIIDISGGEAWHLPTKEAILSEPVWSPDGTGIFFTANVFSKPETWMPYPGCPDEDRQRAEKQAKRSLEPKNNKEKNHKDDAINKQNNIKVITRLRYRMDGIGYYGDLRRQVSYIDVPHAPPAQENLEAVQITHGDFDHSAPAISPDGKLVAVSAYRSGDADYKTKQDLWIFDVDTKNAHLLYNAPGPIYSLKWSPDGTVIAFYGHDNARNASTRQDLFVCDVQDYLKAYSECTKCDPLDSVQVENLTGRFDLHAGGFISSDISYWGGSSLNWDGTTLYFSVAHHGTPYIYSATKRENIWKLNRVCGFSDKAISAYSVSNGKIVFKASSPLEPENLFLVEVEQSKQAPPYKQLTFENTDIISNVILGKCEKFNYKSKDGQELDGWLIHPAEVKLSQIKPSSNTYKYPLLVLVHGGPHSAYGSAFMFNAQLFAGRGYAVAYFNPRGSTSYGQEFMACIDGNWGDKDYHDVMSGIDAVTSLGFIDEHNIFIHGWSYGGYMTTWAITQTNRFKAACAGAPVTDMYSGYGTSDILWADEHEFGGKPWEDPEVLMKSSPLHHVAQVTTPILLLHGENDLRCPILHTEEFYTALRRLGKTAIMVRYPGEFHGLKTPIHRIDRYKRMIAWFEYYRSQTEKSD